MTHFLAWYIKDQWISGYVCGILLTMFGNLIADKVWPRKPK